MVGLGIIEGLGEMDEMTAITQEEISEQLIYASHYGLHHMLHVHHVSGALEMEIEKFFQESITDWLELCVCAERYILIYPFFDWIEVASTSTKAK